jgi:hypothetical protein
MSPRGTVAIVVAVLLAALAGAPLAGAARTDTARAGVAAAAKGKPAKKAKKSKSRSCRKPSRAGRQAKPLACKRRPPVPPRPPAVRMPASSGPSSGAGTAGTLAGGPTPPAAPAPATAQAPAASAAAPAAVSSGRIYWGARIDGEVYGGRTDAPWDTTTWDMFEGHAGGKRVSIVHFGQPAPWKQGFVRAPFDKVTARGAIPYVSMSSESVALTSITAGTYDSQIAAWARAVKAYGKPFFLRWNWEMNGAWFNWGAQAKANPAAFVASWRHMHDIVAREGATNVTWTWCPNIVFSTATPLASLYPGDDYVDWTCMDGYNFGTLPFKRGATWQPFGPLIKPTYDALLALAPTKPIMIGETAATEYGGSKANWITDALTTQIPQMPAIKALVWFNWNITEQGGTHDWQIESSASAQTAFAHAISSPYYAANNYGNLPALRPVPAP